MKTAHAAPVTLSFLARLEAKPGKEAEVEALLRSALSLAMEEPGTVHWFALRIGPSTFGVFPTPSWTRRAARRTSRAPSPPR